ncbi:MAG TPA: hypothetical protein VK579_08285 [Terriglobales bacterium]|jgi:hypothetical protein|nr:hypothetical protein [Terriglobales bacterium]
MANESEKNQQNPGQRQQGDPGNTAEPTRKDPSQSGDVHNPQDPTKKNPGQSGDTSDRKDREGSEDVEKRRAS